MQWLEKRLPIGGLIYSSFIAYPTPRNLNYWWTFGGILSFMLGVQIITGIVLAMHYTPHVDLAFKSVEGDHARRQLTAGCCATCTPTAPRCSSSPSTSTCSAACITAPTRSRARSCGSSASSSTCLMMATGFMGYVLVWGQMSFWAATVITNLFSAIPGVGDAIVTWLWGGFAVGNPTLNRFYSLHYLLPFVIAGVVVLHVWALHVTGQNNPAGIEPKSDKDTVPFTPYATVKDGFFIAVFLHPVRLVRVLHPELSRPSRQLHPGQPGGDAVGDRAGMVLPAVLRHPAFDPEQAARRHRAVLLDRDPRLPALARHVEGALGALPAALSSSSSGCS